MPFYDLTCPQGHQQFDLYLKVGERPPCPSCGGPTETLWLQANSVIGDEIPGGYVVYHGICNEDGSPRKYYSKSDMAKEAKRRGLINQVEHVVDPTSGSDKSRHTVRWH